MGGGIIGLSLAIELRKRNVTVLVVERGEPGREASHAAAGMLADTGIESSPLKVLASASARMYPEFVHELQDDSGIDCDLRDHGTLRITSSAESTSKKISEFEPHLPTSNSFVEYVNERSVDPRALTSAALKVAKHREVDFLTGSTALELLLSDGKTCAVRTGKSIYSAPVVVNCLGAWAGQFGPVPLPVRPVKGQMVCMLGGPPLRHVIRCRDDVYIVPRSDGRIIVGSTLEEAGFDKRTNPEIVLRLRDAAVKMVPELAAGRILESWAGLRPGTSDDLPILGSTSMPGYFVATGHFRDGILLAPITTQVMASLILGKNGEYDLSPFAAERFGEGGHREGPDFHSGW